MITQIILGSKGSLDLTDDVIIPLNFSVAEIQDISKRQGGYSKTIVVPGTPNNNYLFNSIYDVNISTTSFDQNIREKCMILKNGIPVFNGYLQMLSVNKRTPSQLNPDEFIEYELQIKDDTGDFYSVISDKLLTDLSGFTQYNHQYNLTNILATSGNTWNNGYKYAMMYNLNDYYQLKDFQPMIFAKQYFDKIWEQAGYSYKWDNLTDTGFDKMVIPYNGDKPIADNTMYNFQAGLTGSTYFTCDTNITSTKQLVFNEDSISPNNDPYNMYNPLTGIWTSTFNGVVEFKAKYYYTISMVAPVTCKAIGVGNGTGNGSIKIKMEHKFGNPSYGINIPVSNGLVVDDELWHTTSTNYALSFAAGTTVLYSGTTDEIIGTGEVFNGSPIKNYINGLLTLQGDWVTNNFNPSDPINFGGGTFISAANKPYLRIDISAVPVTNEAYFKTNVSGELGENMIVDLNSFIPKQIKQKDFIAGIANMFNLYITPSTENDKQLIIETRDDFYDNGGTKDWSNKFQPDITSTVKFLPDLQNKKLRLSYKADSDVFNKQYTQATGEIYGQVDYTFTNEFVKGLKTIETIFSPSPINENIFNCPVSTIDSRAPKTNIRILFDGGWIPVANNSGNTWTYRNSTATTVTQTFSKYPYAGHFYPDPYNPTLDLNYMQTDYLFYNDWENITNNSLYNKYWKRFINQIETGKLLTAKFNLDESDIMNLNFRDKIWIHDTYWYLNKIVDYNGGPNKILTTVELISVDEGIKFEKFTTSHGIHSTTPFITNSFTQAYLMNEYSLLTASNHNTFGSNVRFTNVLGGGNTIASSTKSTSINGSYNYVGASNSLIVGTNNIVNGNSIVFGDNNTIDSMANNAVILGSNISATTSDTVYVPNLVIASGGTINGYPAEAATLWLSGSGVGSVYQNNGTNNIASGTTSFVEGSGNKAIGIVSHAEGQNTIASGSVSHSEGDSTTASGTLSHAEGSGTISSGTTSHSEGANTIAGGNQSHAEGNGTTALGDFGSHAEGYNTTATGNNSHAEGWSNIVTGSSAHVEGAVNYAYGDYCHVEGKANTGTTTHVHVEGSFNIASNNNAHCEGAFSIASGITSHAEGRETIAGGDFSHSEGRGTSAMGMYAHAEGYYSIASGNQSHAEGGTTTASGTNSHAEGANTTASTQFSHAGGDNAIASRYGEFARGGGVNSQYGSLSYYTFTTNNTPTEIFLMDGAGSKRFTIEQGGFYRVIITGVISDGTNVKEVITTVLIKNYLGTTSIIGTPTITSTFAEAAMATSTIAVSADNVNDSLKITVTGLAGPATTEFSLRADYIALH